MELKPNKKEIDAAMYLKSLFKFPTIITYYIYDYSRRSCSIIIEADNEPDPPINSSTSHYLKGPNSIKLHEFANKLPKESNQWYCYRRGFAIPYERILQLKSRLKK